MICAQCNKEFIPTHHSQKYCSKECTKIFKKEYQKNYFKSDKGKSLQKKYNSTEKRIASRKKYDESPKGKENIKKKLKKYQQSVGTYETNKRLRKIAQKKYQQTDKYKQAQKRYKQSDKGREYHRKYAKTDKAKNTLNKYLKQKRKSDPIYKLVTYARGRLYKVLKHKNIKKTNTTIKLFGCTKEFLKKHIEKQFHPHPDYHHPMNWLNYTVHGWHIDHIIPLDSAKTPEDVEKLMHYTNLQPMWAEYNIKKGNKY